MHRTLSSIPRLGIIAAFLLATAFALQASPAFAAAPTITAVSPATGSAAGGVTVVITGTNFTGTACPAGVTFGGTAATSCHVDSDTQITAVTPPHAVGNVNVVVTNDGASTDNGTADDFTYVANAIPSVTGLSPSTGSTLGGVTITVNGTNFLGATQVNFGGTMLVPFNVNNTTLQVLNPAHGPGVVDVFVTTPGGTSANTGSDNFTYTAAGPTVTAVAPPGGPLAGGNTVTVTGTGLTGATQVTFGGVPGTGISGSDTSLTVTAPAHVAGTVDVLVTTPVGTSSNTAADDYVYGSAPTITLLTPATGPVAGGMLVTITGTNLTGASAVSFGGTPGTSVTVVNATTVTVISPAHAAGTVDVTVTTASGTSTNTAADDFTFSAAPFITGVAPASGGTVGGTSVVITGSGFTGVTAVTFGGTAATTFTVNSNTQITATSPAHTAGTVDIVATSPAGTSANTTADNFVYGSGPAITSVSPAQGPIAGGTVVTITGTGFTGATAVKFGSTAASTFTVVSDTQITATSPAGVNGVVDISVTTPIGTSTAVAGDKFTYGTGATISFTLYFRWTLIVWSGKDGADIATVLKNLETPTDNPATNDVSGAVTAVYHFNNPLQKFEGWFPGSAGIPGANDFSTFRAGEGYWIAISTTGSLNWTTTAN